MKRLLTMACVATAVLLSGCNANPYSSSYQIHDSNYQHMADQIRQAGGIVIMEGAITRFVLPNTVFFKPGTSQLKPQKQAVLNDIAEMILTYRAPRVSVIAYWDNSIVNSEQAKAFSARYAKTVASILWNQGVPVEFMRVKGAGDNDNVSPNRLDYRADNTRVEIVVK